MVAGGFELVPCFTPVDAYRLEDGRVRFTSRGNHVAAFQLPCGQCVGCRKDRAHEWAARILHESQCHDISWFVTLTYDDDHVPRDGSLHYSDFQDFMRRLRRYINPRRKRGEIRARRKVSFFVAGEYGETTSRPHFHACLFGWSPEDLAYYRKSPSGHTLWRSEILDKLWSHGLCSLGAITFESAAYVASYVCKKAVLSDSSPSKLRERYQRVDCTTGEVFEVEPEFARMSLKPAIGRRWFDRFSSDCLPRDYCVVDGRKIRVPRYYCDLFRARDLPGFAGLEVDRFERSQATASDRTPERLAVRHAVATAKMKLGVKKL